MRALIRIVENSSQDDDSDDQYDVLPSSEKIRLLTPEIANAAQEIYDEWDQSDPDNDDLNGGGICHLISDSVADILYRNAIPCITEGATDEQHVYVVAQCSDGVWYVDIPWSVYERGGGFTWTKIPGVIFQPNDVIVRKLDSNPANIAKYVSDWGE